MPARDYPDEETHALPVGASAAAPTWRQPTLRWTDAAGAHVAALAARARVGSSSNAEIVVADPTVSRLHAEFEFRDGAVWVRDLASRNGTFVDDVMVTAARVPPDGRVRLGAATLTVGVAPEPTKLELWSDERYGSLVGRSLVMRQLFSQLARVARSDAAVLIHGETGTGKELIARATHDSSGRAAGPFVVVDCAALPEHLLESELFGHARGAFTGAANRRVGSIEAAHGGTVFLDEIGELPIAMQPKLLRAVESRTIRRIGESEYRKIDVRFISATHRDLGEMVNSGAFREDLYFRLAVLPLAVPPLRARPEDIPLLIATFVPRSQRAPFTPELLHELASRPWLGNVRELRNFVERALALGAEAALRATFAPSAGASHAPEATPAIPAPPAVPDLSTALLFKEARERAIDAFERAYVAALLAEHDHNVAAAARAAGLDRTYLYRLLRKHSV